MVEVTAAPSADLVLALVAIDPADLDEAALLAVIAGWERVRSYVQACQNDAFVAYERLACPTRWRVLRTTGSPPRNSVWCWG